MRKVLYDSFDYTLATRRVPVELARILENSLRGSSVTMNFSDRCDTVHVFHSHQNGRAVRLDQVPLTRDVFYPFLFFLSNFSHLLRLSLASTFPRLDDVARSVKSPWNSSMRGESFKIHNTPAQDSNWRPLINNQASQEYISSQS